MVSGSTQALILAGGLGTRLRSVVEGSPKCLVPVAGRPFLEYLVRRLAVQNIRDIVLCVGYKNDQIRNHFGDGGSFEVSISYSIEEELLGTAGALRNAAGQVKNDLFLVLNGDSFIDMSYTDLLSAHRSREARITMAVLESCGTRYGSVAFGPDLAIRGFKEKEQLVEGEQPRSFMNAGVYALSREVLKEIPCDRPVSIENEFFPGQIGRNFCAYPISGYFIDIGIPADYYRAQVEFAKRNYV